MDSKYCEIPFYQGAIKGNICSDIHTNSICEYMLTYYLYVMSQAEMRLATQCLEETLPFTCVF